MKRGFLILTSAVLLALSGCGESAGVSTNSSAAVSDTTQSVAESVVVSNGDTSGTTVAQNAFAITDELGAPPAVPSN